MAQFAYNSADNEATRMSPFRANYGYDPEIARKPLEGELAPVATVQVEKLKELQAALQQDLTFLQQRMKEYADQTRLKGATFREGERVYLLRRNIKTKRPSEKLDFKKIGPFKIAEVISETNYRLSLPKTMRIHPIFHISLLEPAAEDTPIDTQLEVETDQHEYEVEKIIDGKKTRRGPQYLVQWKGYPPEDNTWEPRKHLTNAVAKLQEFERENPQPADQDPRNRSNRKPPSPR